MTIRLHFILGLKNCFMFLGTIEQISGLMKLHLQLKGVLASMLESALEYIKLSEQLPSFLSYCSIGVVSLLIPKLQICIFVVKVFNFLLVFLTFEVVFLYLFEVVSLSLPK